MAHIEIKYNFELYPHVIEFMVLQGFHNRAKAGHERNKFSHSN